MLVDRGHRSWAAFSLVALVVAAAAYVRYAASAPNGPEGGSTEGLVFGFVGTGFIFFAAFLGVRKTRPAWRIGRASWWLKGHLWLGALAFPIILFHAGFGWGGPLASVLMGSFWVVFLTGLFGLALQQVVPRLMTEQLPQETVYEQIDHVRNQLLEEAVALVRGKGSRRAVARPKRAGAVTGRVVESRAAVEADESDEIRRPVSLFLDEQMRPFFKRHGYRGSSLADRHARTALFADLRNRTDPSLHALVGDLEALCTQRNQLEAQRRLHHWLHGWLLVHVPLSWLMVVLTLVHAVTALWY
ncbi:MAG: hypothetical protein ACYTHK_15535 [Planctomycetota bacterium]